MKNCFTLITLSLLLTACASENLSEFSDPVIGELQDCNILQSRSSYSFDNILESNEWKCYESLEQKQDACQVPEDILKKMSTPELIQLCLDYPLAVNIFFHSDPINAVNLVYGEFNGFQELISRDDAASCLFELYQSVDIGKIAKMSDDITKKGKSVLKLNYLEAILYSGVIPNVLESDEINKIAKNKLVEKELYPDIFGDISIRSSKYLKQSIIQRQNRIPLKAKDSLYAPTSLESATEFYVYTRGGKAVQAFTRPETVTSADITLITNQIKGSYPNATILGNPSTQYNCHSYAWNMIDGGPKCWINSTTIGGTPNDNISKYWTNDYFEETTNQAEARIVFYDGGDHSARVSSVAGMFDSKWGELSLVRHLPHDCPYNSNNIRYFKGIGGGSSTENEPTATVKISVDKDITSVGGSIYVTYSFTSNEANAYAELVVYDGKDEIVNGSKVTLTPNATWGQTKVTFHLQGIYEIAVIVYAPDGNIIKEERYNIQILVNY